jgi:hypothetical protein
VFVPNSRRLSRRRFTTLASAAAAAALIGRSAPVAAADVSLQVPYFPQGGTGDDSSVNCGPSTVAAAVNYSGVAFPTVQDVRATLGLSGPTDIDQWAWLLDAYGVPWFPTWTQPDMDDALRTGHVLVIAAWMADFSTAADFEQPYSSFWGQSGRYSSFGEGHAMLIVGTSDDGANYLIHDPNVFPYDGTSFYGDGAPKGAYRPYSAIEVWNTVGGYASGQALAVSPMTVQAPAPPSVKRVRPEDGDRYLGPGGGHAPERGDHGVTGVIVPNSSPGVISAADDDGEAD